MDKREQAPVAAIATASADKCLRDARPRSAQCCLTSLRLPRHPPVSDGAAAARCARSSWPPAFSRSSRCCRCSTRRRAARAPAAAAEFPVPAVLGPEQPAAAARNFPLPRRRRLHHGPLPRHRRRRRRRRLQPGRRASRRRGLRGARRVQLRARAVRLPAAHRGRVRRPAVPKCASQWGLELPIAPCQALALEARTGATSRRRASASSTATASTSGCVRLELRQRVGTPILPLNHESIKTIPPSSGGGASRTRRARRSSTAGATMGAAGVHAGREESKSTPRNAPTITS